MYLEKNIRQKKERQVLGTENINPIKEEALIFPKDSELKYFYEPLLVFQWNFSPFRDVIFIEKSYQKKIKSLWGRNI